MITFLLPTRNRPDALARTLEALSRIGRAAIVASGGGEVIVVDNDSSLPARSPRRLANGLPVHLIRLEENRAAAGRNVGALAARGEWLMMLDDDSWPLDVGFVSVIANAPADVAAIGAEILLPDGSHEAGGLPEVIVGCGALVRRDAFLAVGGYDATFGYYAEEYDLCAKFILAGGRIVHDWRFRVRHEKIQSGRDMNVILRHLVRNNAWVMERYAPGSLRERLVDHTIQRYRRIAEKESAHRGWSRGVTELDATLARQVRRPMSARHWDRFTGAAAARAGLASCAGMKAAIIEPGKGAEVIRDVLGRHDAEIVEIEHAEAFVIGALSPGPMMDAAARLAARGDRVITAWRPDMPRAMTPAVIV